MKLGNLNGRAVLLSDEGALDIATASADRFGPSLDALYAQWDDFVAAAPAFDGPYVDYDPLELGPPSSRPSQVFAIGLNYRDHATESGMEPPSVPAVFTKFPASLNGPYGDIEVAGEMVDWEVELVVVMGRTADRVAADDAWSCVAGLCIGQDISDRHVQFAAGGQFSLGKSYRSYAPTGPWLVTLDEFADPSDLALGCSIDGEVVQESRTSNLIFDIPRLIAELSAVLALHPGDLIFTGTPAGVGMARQPPRFLTPGNVLESWIEGIGTLRNACVAATDAAR
jgi:2,4-didehydro-3-deoxy-L-rhamnonate hydrolase